MASSELFTHNEYDRYDSNLRIHDVPVVDPYENADTRAMVLDKVAELTAMGFYGDASVDLRRTRKGRVDRDNPATKALSDFIPTFSDWHATVPRAEALDPLYNPTKTHLPNGKEISPLLQEFFRNLPDAKGIRSRAVVADMCIEQEALQREEPLRVASLACGAAQPIVEVAKRLRDTHITPELTLVDYDQAALSYAQQSIDNAELQEGAAIRRMNILQPSGLAHRDAAQQRSFVRRIAEATIDSRRLPREQYDVVEALGFVEYLKEDDWDYTYRSVITTKRRMAGANTFLRNAYELVKPGGVLLIGNMRDTHPTLGFTLNTVQWPHIQPRSVDEVSAMLRTVSPNDDIDVYLPDDQVYGVYAMRKGL